MRMIGRKEMTGSVSGRLITSMNQPLLNTSVTAPKEAPMLSR